MPIYTYQVIKDDGSFGDCFEVVAKMSDEALTLHPETGEKVQRVYRAPNVAYRYTEMAAKQKMSNKNLDRIGFTKYQNEGGGTYRKMAGEGPQYIQRK
jgi:hypothetical protein